MLKSRGNSQDKAILDQHKDATAYSMELALGNKITAEQNAMIVELNQKLSSGAQKVTAETLARTRGGNASDYLI